MRVGLKKYWKNNVLKKVLKKIAVEVQNWQKTCIYRFKKLNKPLTGQTQKYSWQDTLSLHFWELNPRMGGEMKISREKDTLHIGEKQFELFVPMSSETM